MNEKYSVPSVYGDDRVNGDISPFNIDGCIDEEGTA